MELKGEYRISASRERVWEALNDPEILKKSIPGCSALEVVGDNSFAATVTAKVGPVKANFQGQVTLSDIDPPNGYTIQGEGKGGPAGFAKGGAKVTLEPDGDGSLLRYEVEANVGGKLAQIGSRLIDGTAKKLSGEFFDTFATLAEDESKRDEASTTQSASDALPVSADEDIIENKAASKMQIEEKENIKLGDVTQEDEKLSSDGLPTWIWISGLIIIIAIILWVFSSN